MELCYLCNENKGPDQLPSYHAADLCLCFRLCEKLVFSRCGLIYSVTVIKTVVLLNFVKGCIY